MRDTLPQAERRTPLTILCCGSLDRGDDGAGVLVARGLRARGIDAREVTTLVDAWEPGDDVIVVDAMTSGRDVGAMVSWDATELPEDPSCRSSTHGLGLSEALGLARALDRLPARLRVYGIEGREFGVGRDVSPEVARAIEVVTARIAALASSA